MKIQFIVTGWHFSQDSLIDGLHELDKDNDSVDVFWSCSWVFKDGKVAFHF